MTNQNKKIVEQNRINRILNKNGYFENFNWNYKKPNRDYNRLTVRQKGDYWQFKLEEMNIGLSTADFHYKLEFWKKTKNLRFAITLWKVKHDEVDKFNDEKIATLFGIRKARRFVKKGLIDFLIQKEKEKSDYCENCGACPWCCCCNCDETLNIPKYEGGTK